MTVDIHRYLPSFNAPIHSTLLPLAALTCAAALGISGCAAGLNSATSQAHSLGEGIDATNGPIHVGNALLVVPNVKDTVEPEQVAHPEPLPPPADPGPTEPGPTNPSAADQPPISAPYLSMMVANTSSQPVDIRTIEVVTVGPAVLSGPTMIPARGALTVGQLGTTTTQASVPGWNGPAGPIVTLNLRFSDGTVINNLQTIAVNETHHATSPEPSQERQ